MSSRAVRPTVRRATRRVLATVAVGVLVGPLAACSDGGDDPVEPRPTATPATQTPAPPPPAAPKVGACYDLPFDAAVAPTVDAPPVPCSKPHTAQTVYVGRIDAVVGGHLVAVDSARVQAQVAEECPRRLGRYVGGSARSLRLSMLRPVWFTPTLEQSDAGADWFRCDAVLLAGSSELAKVRGSFARALAGRAPRPAHAMCGTAAPDAKDFQRVPCSARHTWRAVDVVTFRSGRYPGEKAVRAAGRSVCEDAGAEVADDPLDFRWGYEWPTRDQWRTGMTFGRCWAPR